MAGVNRVDSTVLRTVFVKVTLEAEFTIAIYVENPGYLIIPRVLYQLEFINAYIYCQLPELENTLGIFRKHPAYFS